MGQKMLLQLSDLPALHMDQPPADLALEVIADRTAAVPFRVDEFKAGAASVVEGVLFDLSLVNELFQLAVDGGGADGTALLLKMAADVRGGEMMSAGGTQIGDDVLPLFGLVL